MLPVIVVAVRALLPPPYFFEISAYGSQCHALARRCVAPIELQGPGHVLRTQHYSGIPSLEVFGGSTPDALHQPFFLDPLKRPAEVQVAKWVTIAFCALSTSPLVF